MMALAGARAKWLAGGGPSSSEGLGGDVFVSRDEEIEYLVLL